MAHNEEQESRGAQTGPPGTLADKAFTAAWNEVDAIEARVRPVAQSLSVVRTSMETLLGERDAALTRLWYQATVADHEVGGQDWLRTRILCAKVGEEAALQLLLWAHRAMGFNGEQVLALVHFAGFEHRAPGLILTPGALSHGYGEAEQAWKALGRAFAWTMQAGVEHKPGEVFWHITPPPAVGQRAQWPMLQYWPDQDKARVVLVDPEAETVADTPWADLGSTLAYLDVTRGGAPMDHGQ